MIEHLKTCLRLLAGLSRCRYSESDLLSGQPKKMEMVKTFSSGKLKQKIKIGFFFHKMALWQFCSLVCVFFFLFLFLSFLFLCTYRVATGKLSLLLTASAFPLHWCLCEEDWLPLLQKRSAVGPEEHRGATRGAAH